MMKIQALHSAIENTDEGQFQLATKDSFNSRGTGDFPAKHMPTTDGA